MKICNCSLAGTDSCKTCSNYPYSIHFADDLIKLVLSAHPEIIRCKYCTWHQDDTVHGKIFCTRDGAMDRIEPDSYCSYGERETDGSD